MTSVLLEEWHEQELAELVANAAFTPEQNLEYFNTIFLPNVMNADGWAVSDLRFVKGLLKLEGELVITLKI